jgi:uncharacterized protein YkwD
MTTNSRRRGLLAALPAALLAVLILGTIAPVATVAINANESRIMTWINRDRVALGLKPLRGWGKLHYVAGLRAARMASANKASHTVAGSLGSQLSSKGVRSWMWGENIGYTTYPRGVEAAKSLYRLWKQSPSHWALIVSRRFNYVGVGTAYRSSNGKTFASIVFTESPDHTGARSSISGVSASGRDVTWKWRGYDVALQTHTAGFKNFDVQYRVDRGSWRTIRSGTTTTSLTLANRSGGHYYGLRVRGRDRAGNVGSWTSEKRIWVR